MEQKTTTVDTEYINYQCGHSTFDSHNKEFHCRKTNTWIRSQKEIGCPVCYNGLDSTIESKKYACNKCAAVITNGFIVGYFTNKFGYCAYSISKLDDDGCISKKNTREPDYVWQTIYGYNPSSGLICSSCFQFWINRPGSYFTPKDKIFY